VFSGDVQVKKGAATWLIGDAPHRLDVDDLKSCEKSCGYIMLMIPTGSWFMRLWP